MDVSDPPSLTIACDDCAMQHTIACDDCVVSFFIGRGAPPVPLTLDQHEEEAVRLLTRAGLVPASRHRLAG